MAAEYWVSLEIIQDPDVLALSASPMEAVGFVLYLAAACLRSWPKGVLGCYPEDEFEYVRHALGHEGLELDKERIRDMMTRGLEVGLLHRHAESEIVDWSFHDIWRYARLIGGEG